ncbi:MAG: MFS transporter [Actinomycetota bacterium]|nr:MFS transporter [Actinomycetota bacterium]
MEPFDASLHETGRHDAVDGAGGRRRADPPAGERRRAQDLFVTSPFARLARTHAFSAGGDAMVAVALAGSLFFSADPNESRGSIALYLLLTMAPFAVVAPFIGPVIDRARSGRRLMIVGTCVTRAFVALLMTRHLDSLLLFPEAFVMLVMGKAYQVARSALVPMTVRDRASLVGANSKLALLSAIAGAIAVVPAGAVSFAFGSQWVVFLAMLLFTTAAVLAWKLPKEPVATEPADVAELAELRSAGVRLAATSMGVLRGSVGFVTFLLAFALRDADAPAWQYGIVVGATGLATMAGSAVGPTLRRVTTEELMLTGAVGGAAVMGIVTALLGGLEAMVLMAMTIGIAAGSGKLAFDSLVQRDAPDANQGRSFAKFEARFQVIWVFGAFLPVVIPLPARVGYVMIAIAAGVAAAVYVFGRQALVTGRPPVWEGWRSAVTGDGARTEGGGAEQDPGPGADPTADAPDEAAAERPDPTAQAPGDERDAGEPTVRFRPPPPSVVEPPFETSKNPRQRRPSPPTELHQAVLPFDDLPLNDAPFEPSGYRHDDLGPSAGETAGEPGGGSGTTAPSGRAGDGDEADRAADDPVERDERADELDGPGAGRAGQQWRSR